jgi:hypothetical protein
MSRHPLLLAPVLGALLLPAPALAGGGCSETVEITVDRLGGLDDELLRVADLVGATPLHQPRLIRRGGPRREQICTSTPASVPFERFAPEVVTTTGRRVDVYVLPLLLGTVWNSRYPSGDNDELLWAGRGFSQILSGGASLHAGMLTLTLAPQVSWSENKAFEIVPTGLAGPQRFANAFYPNPINQNGIDLPQRFGAGPFATWSFGQSALSLERWNAQVGVSTESLWIGSGIRNSILMTNTAPGFPHVFLGTARPVDTWIGDLEALVFWGRLERSQYAYEQSHPLLEGLLLTYSPRWTPGLSVGLGSLYVQAGKDLRFRDWFGFARSPATEAGGPGALNNQLVSVFFRWVFPESGAEVYGEWAREDSADDIYDFIHDPDHSQAYLIGLDKVFRAGSGLLRVYVELLQLQNLRNPANPRGVPVYYIHVNGLDFTNRGQLLGAGVGPGGSSQTLAVDWFHRGGRIGGYFERVLRNDEYFWEFIDQTKGTLGRDVELRVGARQVLAVGPVEVSWDASWARRWQRDFIDWENDTRLMVELTVPLDGGRSRRAPLP